MQIQDDDDSVPVTGDRVVLEATERWTACKDYYGVPMERVREDIKFANADPRNAWQWPSNLYETRSAPGTDLPCLTINNTRTHNDMVINELSKNGYGIKIRPTGGKASYQSAQVMQSIIRRIEYISKASSQYRRVAEHQVDGGIGYIIIETAWVGERSFNQDIYLRAARDPTAVYLDPWCREPDGSDANFGFVFERMPRKVFNRKYPKYKNKVGTQPIDSSFQDWISDKEIMLVKYYRKKGKSDTLVAYKTDDGEDHERLASEIRAESGGDLYKQLIEDIEEGRIEGRTRKVTNNEVEWFLIAGDTVIEKDKWAGKYIPICRCVGRELVIDATLDLKGHTRPLIDAQRMLNYNASTAVLRVALEPRSPWVAPARAIEGQECWKSANVNNFAVLTYNDVDDEAPNELQKIDKPERVEPPRGPTSYDLGMQTAERQMMMISGQFQAQMGENDQQSAASGKAISERQAQGDTATYHFVEHRSDMLRHIGVQLLDLIPKIYDNDRAMHVMDDRGEKQWIKIDPNQAEAIQTLKHEAGDEEAIKLAFNPSIGEYECVSDPGPDYATQRQEAWNAMSMILQQNMQLAGVIGDLLFKNGDFPGADEIAERMKKEIEATKPYLFGDGLPPQMAAMQQQIEKLTGLNAELMQKLAASEIKYRGKEELRGIEAYEAETKRIVGLGNTAGDLGADVLRPVIRQVISEMLGNPLAPIDHHVAAALDLQTHENEQDSDAGPEPQDGKGANGEEQAPLQGARKSPHDGNWYVKKGGQHFRVDMR